MKKLIFFIVLSITINSYGQYRGTRQNAPLVRTETYVTNSPGNSIANSWLTGFDKDSTAIAWGYPSVQFWKHKSSRNDGAPTSIAWFDSDGYIKRSPLPAWITTESDPIWSAVAVSYRTKSQNDLLYEPIFTKNTAFNKNFGIIANTVAEGNDSRIVNAVPNTRTVNSKALSSNIILDKADIGLTNVDNTSDLNKPISTATQTALNGKLSAEIDGSVTNEIQALSISGNNLSLSLGGGMVTLPVTIYTAGTGVSISGNVITNTSPDQLVSITGAGGLNVTGAYPAFTATQYVPTDNIVTRTINTTPVNYTISATKSATVRYAIKISCTATIGSASVGKVLFQYSTNGGSTWIDGGELENSNTVTLAVVLNSVTTQTTSIVWSVPANALCRLVPTVSGTTTITWVRGQETY